MNCSNETISNWIESLSNFTVKDQPYTRLSYTKEDLHAKAYLIEEMKALGLQVSMDRIGNIFGRRLGTNKNLGPVLIGSHMDTVKCGGKYDGIAGIVTGLEIIRILNAHKIETSFPIDIVAFAEEEGGSFKTAFIGSQYFIGKISNDELKNFTNDYGLSLNKVIGILDQLNVPLHTPEIVDNITAMIELHIEQGPVLEHYSADLGIVNAITGSSSFSISLVGEANHAGAVPMNLRKDAFFVASLISLELNQIVINQKQPCVGTIGSITVSPNVYNIIPGTVDFTMDIRSLDSSTLEKVINHMKKHIHQQCLTNGLTYNFKENHKKMPVPLSQELSDLLKNAAIKRNYSYHLMGSGAGHDSMIFHSLCPTAMVFVPSKNSRSHCPEEYTDISYISKGANIILDVLLYL